MNALRTGMVSPGDGHTVPDGSGDFAEGVLTSSLRLRGGGRSSNDGDLLRALHERYAHALWAYVLGLTSGDRGRAEDAVQETMLRAWRQGDVLEQSEGSVRGWLFTVARRIVIDQWRSSRSRPEVITDEPPEGMVPDASDASVNRAVVVAALRRLSDDHRRVLLECYVRGSTVAEAAVALGIPPGTVKSRTHYALRAFKEAVQEIGGVL